MRRVLVLVMFFCVWTSGTPSHADVGHALIPLFDSEVVLSIRVAEKQLEDGRFRSAIRRLQQLNRRALGRNLIVPEKDFTQDQLKSQNQRVWKSVSDYIVDLLRGLPDEAVEFYRGEYDLAARSLYAHAMKTRSTQELENCLLLYPIASVADEVALAAAELFLESGDAFRARQALSKVRYDQVATNAQKRELALRWLMTASRGGDEAAYKLWAERLSGLDPSYPDDRLPPPPQSQEQKPIVLPSLPFEDGHMEWQTALLEPRLGGTAAGSEFGPTLHVGRNWVGISTQQTPRNQQSFVRCDLEFGRRIQTQPLPRPDNNRFYSDEDTRDRTYMVGKDKILIGNWVYYATTEDQFYGYDIVEAVPKRALRAVRVESTRRDATLWDTTRSSDEVVSTLSFNSKPIIVGDRVYAIGWRWAGYINVHLVCLDLHTGEPLWRSIVAGNQIELTMFGEISREPHLGEILVEDGVVYAGSNLGVLVAARADDGRVLWVTEYDSIQVKYNADRQAPKPDFWWERNPMLSLGRRLYVTPLDCHDLLVVNKATGDVELIKDLGKRRSWFMLGLYEDPATRGRSLVFCGKESGITLLPVRNLMTKEPQHFDTKGQIYARPALVDNGIVYSTKEGIYFRPFDVDFPPLRVVKFRRSDGKKIRKDGAITIVGERILVTSSLRVACYEKKPEPANPFEGGRK